MNPTSSLDVLIAQIELQLERLGSLVITSPVAAGTPDRVARRIVDGLDARGVQTVLYLRSTSHAPGRATKDVHAGARAGNAGPHPEIRSYTGTDAGTPQLARSLLVSEGMVSVASAPGLLEDPTALFLCAAADAVLLVAEARHTTRADLTRARMELQTAGAHLVGAVLSE